MAPEEICKILRDKFGEGVEDSVVEGGHPYAQVAPDRWPEVAKFLCNDERLELNLLRSITALDMLADDKIACIYDLMHVPTERPTALITETYEFAVRVVTNRSDPMISTVSDVWPAAEWHEREAYDLMGVRFSNHPDLRRILCPDDWQGFPLRKDYEFPKEYHGIPSAAAEEK